MPHTESKNILIIQTAFIGDTILASHFARAVKSEFPDHEVHFFLRKGNESVIQGLSSVSRVWVWDKAGGKTWNLIKLISELRKIRFDHVFNLHRHFNSGLVTALMKSQEKIGFRQNPLSFFYSQRLDHKIPHHPDDNEKIIWHEVQRNLQLLQAARPDFRIEHDPKLYRPELPITEKNREKISSFVTDEYYVLAPASVWFTKAWSEEKYRALVEALSAKADVYLIGAPQDADLCNRIGSAFPRVKNLCGKLNLLDSAALMEKAKRVFVNDSAPLHLASCVNAKTTAIFCSTVPAFGYTPLSQNSTVIDVGNSLDCRPCGLHGHNRCPLGHFKCSWNIDVQTVFNTINL